MSTGVIGQSTAPQQNPFLPHPVASTDFYNKLDDLTRPSFFARKIILLSDTHQLCRTNIFRFLWEKIKEAFGYANGINKDLLKSKIIQFLNDGPDWHSPQNLKKIDELWVRALGEPSTAHHYRPIELMEMKRTEIEPQEVEAKEHRNLTKEIASVNAELPMISAAPPVGIVNIGNSCYLSAAVVALMNIPSFMKLLNKELTTGSQAGEEDMMQRRDLQSKLKMLIDSVQNQSTKEPPKASALMQVVRTLTNTGCEPSKAAVKAFRDALFTEKFKQQIHPDFSPEKKDWQHDTVSLLEAILGNVFDVSNPVQLTNFVESEGKVVKNIAPPDKFAVMIVPLPGQTNQHYDITTLIDAVYSTDEEIHNKDHPQPFYNDMGDEFGRFSVYKRRTNLVGNPPDFMVMQFPRKFMNDKGELQINDSTITFPSDQIIDYSKAYDLVSNTADYQYQVLSFICHSGSANSGHYFAYVKRDGHWFELNDDTTTQVNEAAAIKAMEKSVVICLQNIALGVNLCTVS